MKLKIFYDGRQKTEEFDNEITLYDALKQSCVPFSAPCGGKGICLGCKVRAKGQLSKPDSREISCLKDKIDEGYRLACYCFLKGDASVYLGDSNVLFSEVNKPFSDINPLTGKKYCIACVIDIGTTALKCASYKMPECILLDSKTFINPQISFGADVMTRITASENSLSEMKDSVGSVIENFAEMQEQEPFAYIITGNTVMLHILSGLDPKSLGVYPFKPKSLFGKYIGNKYYMPCVSAYIGSDAVASVLASKMLDNRKSIMCDIGTNCEIALWDGKKIYCASSPAGPAFEGASISCGMTAEQGAIISVCGKDDEPIIKTLGNTEPLGICGSGLIDAVHYLLENHFISDSGKMIKAFPKFGNITLEPSDVAEFQLAKSALYTAIMALCDHSGTDINEIEKIYLCGNFGKYINIENAISLGMLPDTDSSKYILCGNTSLEGASMLLLDADNVKKAENIAKSIQPIELSDNKYFQENYLKNLNF